MLLLTASLPGCFSTTADKSSKPEEDAIELSAKSIASLDAPEATLFEDGVRQFHNGLYSVAVETFEALRDGYPLGPYREFAEIKAADCRFELGEYDQAALLYEEFVKSHPGSSAAPYALLRAGRSYQLAQRGIGRDDAPLNKALAAYMKLLNQYPDSVYCEAARTYQAEVRQKLAAYEKMVIDFYKKKDKAAAVSARESEFKQRWGEESSAFELRPVKSSYTERAKEADAQTNIPEGTELPLKTLPPELKDKNTAELAFGASPPAAVSELDSGLKSSKTYLLRSVQCDQKKKFVTIFTGSPYDNQVFLQANQRINSGPGGLVLKIPGLRIPGEKDISEDCLGEKNLTIFSDGTLSWVVEAEEIQLIDLDNPPRLLILAK